MRGVADGAEVGPGGESVGSGEGGRGGLDRGGVEEEGRRVDVNEGGVDVLLPDEADHVLSSRLEVFVVEESREVLLELCTKGER